MKCENQAGMKEIGENSNEELNVKNFIVTKWKYETHSGGAEWRYESWVKWKFEEKWKYENFRWGRVKRAWATFPWVRGIGLPGRISFFFWARFLHNEDDCDDGDDDDHDDDGDDDHDDDGNNHFICPLLSVEHLVWQIIIF